MAPKKKKELNIETVNKLRDEDDDDDDFATPPTTFKKRQTKQSPIKKSDKVERQKKQSTRDKSTVVEGIKRVRTRAPLINLYNVMNELTPEQERALQDIGFGNYIKFKFTEIPTQLGYWVLENFDSKKCQINTKNGPLKITKETIKNTLGIPDGDIKIKNLGATKTASTVIKEWKSQFDGLKHVYLKELVNTMMDSEDAGRLFKLNFLVLFVSVMCECITCGTVNIKFLHFVETDVDIKKIDWCGYVLECLKSTREKWKTERHYNGPLLFLLIFYANSQIQNQTLVPSIKYWNSKKLNDVEKKQLEDGEFEKFETDDMNSGNHIASDDGMLNASKKQKTKKTKSLKRKSENLEVQCSAIQNKKKRTELKNNSRQTRSAASNEAQLKIQESQQLEKDKSDAAVDHEQNAELAESENALKKQRRKKTKGLKRKSENFEVQCSRQTRSSANNAQFKNQESHQLEKDKSDAAVDHEQNAKLDEAENQPLGNDAAEPIGSPGNDAAEPIGSPGNDDRSLSLTPNVYIDFQAYPLPKFSSSKITEPDYLQVFETEIETKLSKIEGLKEYVEDLIRKAEAKCGKNDVLENLRLRKEKMFNESKVGNKSPEKDCQNVEDAPPEEDFVDDTTMHIEIDSCKGKQTQTSPEDWLSQYSTTSSLIEAIGKRCNQEGTTNESQELTFPVFNQVPEFNSAEIKGKQKKDISDALGDFFLHKDNINALQNWKEQTLVPDEIAKKTSQDFVEECLNAKVGPVIDDAQTVDMQQEQNVRDVLEVENVNEGAIIVSSKPMDFSQKNKPEEHMKTPDIQKFADEVTTPASPLTKPPSERQTKEKIRVEHMLKKLQLPRDRDSLKNKEVKATESSRFPADPDKEKIIQKNQQIAEDKGKMKRVLSCVEKEVSKKPDRKVKLPSTMKSPYIIREVLLRKPTITDMLISEYVFSGLHKETDVIFEMEGISAQRRVFECFHPDLTIVPESVDLWSFILNTEETKKSPSAPRKLFCHTSFVNEDMVSQSMEVDILIAKFASNMQAVLKSSEYADIQSVDLVFFPIVQGHHYYLICYNLPTEEYHILDNMEDSETDLNKRYDGVPNLLNEAFSVYLSEFKHTAAQKIKQKKPKYVRLRWKTSQNKIDCGIFTMRHMEMYEGELIKNFDPSMSEEGQKQKQQLEILRRKYVTKMLLSKRNTKRQLVMKEAEDYKKITPNEKKNLKKVAKDKIEQRL